MNLYLASDNPHPRRREESLGYRMGYFASLWGAAGLVLGFWWLIATLVLSLG